MNWPLLRGGFNVGSLRVVIRVSSFGLKVAMTAGGVGEGGGRGEDGVYGRDLVVVAL